MSLFTVGDVAAQLQIGRTTVYELLRSGKLPHHRVGTGRGSIRVRPEDIERYLAACRVSEEEKVGVIAPLKLKHLKLG